MYDVDSNTPTMHHANDYLLNFKKFLIDMLCGFLCEKLKVKKDNL